MALLIWLVIKKTKLIVIIIILFDRYYKTNEVQRFRYDRPFHKGQKNKECEFAVSSKKNNILKLNVQ